MALLLPLILAVYAFADVEFEKIPEESSQIVRVFDVKWQGAKMALYEKSGEKWRRVSEVWSVSIGRSGVGKRKEGDGKTPLGIYSLNEVYGYKDLNTSMPFYLSTEKTLCIDDVNSRYYNRIVDSEVVKRDYKSFEYMRRRDGLYEIVVTVGYNPRNIPGRGSCIFLHIGSGDKPTAGCVAMEKEKIKRLVEWLDPKREPLIVITE